MRAESVRCYGYAVIMWPPIILLSVAFVLLFIPNHGAKKTFKKVLRRKALTGRTKKLVERGTKIFAHRCSDKELFEQWLGAGASLQVTIESPRQYLTELQAAHPEKLKVFILRGEAEPPLSASRFIVFDYPLMAWLEDEASCDQFSLNAVFLDRADAPFDRRTISLKTYFTTEVGLATTDGAPVSSVE